MFERLFTVTCVLISVMIFHSSSHGQTLPRSSDPAQNPTSQDSRTSYLEALQKLAQTHSVDSSHVGFAAMPGPNYTAFQRVSVHGQTTESKISELLPTATPAGQLYLSTLIRRIDLERGTELLMQLASDPTPVSGLSGCIMQQSTIGAIATKLLASDVDMIPTISLTSAQ